MRVRPGDDQDVRAERLRYFVDEAKGIQRSERRIRAR
jgi:hypothetical protein